MPAVVLKKRPLILICEADQQTPQPLVDHLSAKGYTVRLIQESGRAIDQIITRMPDIVLLDPQIPEAGGYEVCGAVRPLYQGPILFIGRDGDETAQLLAFERGGDDYILAPVSPALLAARIAVHLKRSPGWHEQTCWHRIRVGELVVDAARREVLMAGQPIEMTTIQFDLLWYLARRSGRVVPRHELYEALHKEKYNGFDRSMDVYVSRIRHQLGDDAENPIYLKTIRGVGYLFVGQPHL